VFFKKKQTITSLVLCYESVYFLRFVIVEDNVKKIYLSRLGNEESA